MTYVTDEHFTPRCEPEEILFRWRERAAALSPELQTAKLVRDITRGDISVPLPSSAGEYERMSTANFFAIGLEGTAQRHASMQPNISSPAVEPGKTRSEEKARKRRLAALAWSEENGLDRLDESRALEYYAYGRAPVMIRPEWRTIDGQRIGLPVWDPMDALAAFPAPSTSAADVHPTDCIFAYERTWGWILRAYPDEAKYLFVGETAPDMDALFELVRYVDDEQDTLLLVGREPGGLPKHNRRRSVLGVYSGVGKTIVDPGTMAEGHYGSHSAVVLRQARNLAGVCPVVMPGRWGLDGRTGQFDGMIGLFFRMQRLQASEDDAIDRGIWPEEWLVNPTGEARVITKADGRRGILGEITNGTIVTRDLNPSYRTTQAIDRLERMLRMEGHIPAEWAGENPTGVRTGVRGDALMNAFISFNLASGHRQMQAARARELEVAALVAREYFGSKKSRFFISWAGASGPVDFTPKDIFTESTRYVVKYPMVGADRNMQQQVDLSKVGAGMMSRETAMSRDPDVDDVEAERDRLVAERVQEAGIVSFETQAANPEGPYTPRQVARIARLVRENKMDLFAAIEKVDEEIREEQAAQQPEPVDPALMPGLNGEPQMAEPTAPPSLESLLGSLAGGGAGVAA